MQAGRYPAISNCRYLLSYKDRSASLDEPRYKRLTSANGILPPTIVMDGRVAGTWEADIQKSAVVITPNPFAASTAAERHALAAAYRYGEFLGMSVALS